MAVYFSQYGWGFVVFDWQRVIAQMAGLQGINFDHEFLSGSFTSPDVHGGAPLSGYQMAAALRLMRGGAVGVVAHGWLDYKDACRAYGIPWESCVMLSSPDQLKQCDQVLLGRDADKRHDWRQWVGKIPRTRSDLPSLIARTASPDLPVARVAMICGVTVTTARRWITRLDLPFKKRVRS